MSSNYIFSHSDISTFSGMEAELHESDSRLRNIEYAPEPVPDWFVRSIIFAIKLPSFDAVENWDELMIEYEKWYHSIAITTLTEKVENHIKDHNLEDIVKFRGTGSMHHRFGVAFDSFLMRLQKHGLTADGTNRQKSSRFWSAVTDGTLTEEQIHTALRESLLPPVPDIKTLPQGLHLGNIRASTRPCYINFAKTLHNFEGIDDFLEHLFLCNRLHTKAVYQDTSIDKELIDRKIDACVEIRATKINAGAKYVDLTGFFGTALESFLIFLFQKGLITMPTRDNTSTLLLSEAGKAAENHFLSSAVLHSEKHFVARNRAGNRASSTNEAAMLTDSFDDPLTEYILGKLSNRDNSTSSNDNPDDVQGEGSTFASPVALVSSDSITVQYDELDFSNSVLAVYTSNSKAACTYSHYKEGSEGYEIIFNRTDKVVALPKSLRIYDYSSVINDFKSWVHDSEHDAHTASDFLDHELIKNSHDSLYDFIDKFSIELENAIIAKNVKELPSYAATIFSGNDDQISLKKDDFISIGNLFFVYLWLNEYILLPCHTRALAFDASIENYVSGVSSIVLDNALSIRKSMRGQGRSHYINLVERGVRRAITASTPISDINEIHEGHLELIFFYGYANASQSVCNVFRSGVRSLAEFIIPKNGQSKIVGARLNYNGIKKRLPTEAHDKWHPWRNAGLHGWYEWLCMLENKSDRLRGKTTRGHINNYFLPFLLDYSKSTGLPVPETPFGVTPRMIISESTEMPDYQACISKTNIKTKHTVFSAAKHIYDVISENFPSQWKEASFVHPFPKRNPFPHKKRNTTHRRPIESLHLDAIKDVLLSPDENGTPTFSWVKNVYCKFSSDASVKSKRDALVTDEGLVWWPGTAVCLAFLLEVPLRSFQARWLDEGCLDETRFDMTTFNYKPNANKVDVLYPDGMTHKEKHKELNGLSGVLQQRPRSFMEADSNTRGPSLFINTNKTSVEQGKFDQGYHIPWPNEEDTDLPYWLINHMMDFNRKYDPSPKPISLAYEGEMHRANTTRFIYGFHDDSVLLNRYPFVTPLFRDLTKDSRYARTQHNIVFDKDGNEITPPLTRVKLSDLLNAVAVEAEKRLKADRYPDSLASMTDENGKVIYDIHTLRVTGVSRLMAMGVPIEVVRDVVGHAVNVMTYYYTVLDQLKIMHKLRDGLKLDINHFGPADINDKSLINRLIPNTLADESATIQYGGWVERNGGICPSGICDEGGPAILDNEGNTTSFSPVPGGSYRCGNCRLWMTGPRYILQQVHYIDLLMKEIVNKHEDRIRVYESKLETDTEIETLKRNSQEVSQALLAKISEHEANITQLTEKLSHLWMEWRNRYQMLETSISSLDEYRDEINSGSMILFTGQDPLEVKIERHAGSKYGLKRAIANSVIYNMPISHEVSATINELERDLTKLQLFTSSNGGIPISLSHILDDDLRNRAIALHAQHLYLLMNSEHDDADQRIDKIISEISESVPTLDDKEYSALKQWQNAIGESLKDMIQIPSFTKKNKQISFESSLTMEGNPDE